MEGQGLGSLAWEEAYATATRLPKCELHVHLDGR